MYNSRILIRFLVTLSFILTLSISPVVAQCFITGTSTVEVNTDAPDLGAWKYTLEVTWDTGNVHDLSHLDMFFGRDDHSCLCDDFHEAIVFSDTAGFSTGYHGDEICQVDYYGEVLCEGDPSIPSPLEPLVKFEPFGPDSICEPGPTGTGTFWYYTDWPATEVEIPNEFLVEKDSGNFCFGELTGAIPRLGCGLTPTVDINWGAVKQHYR